MHCFPSEREQFTRVCFANDVELYYATVRAFQCFACVLESRRHYGMWVRWSVGRLTVTYII